MIAVASILFLLSLLGILFGIVGVIKGSLKFLKLKSTKASALFLTCSLAVFVFSIIIVPVDSPAEDQKKSSVEEKTKNETEKQKEEVKKEEKPDESKQTTEQETPKATEVTKVETPKGTLEVHFVDVGQGAAQVIVTPNKKVMVIDGGNNDDEDDMVAYLNQLGVKKVDILVGTHPDADHIGGIDAVIDAFDIGKIYMPKIQSNTQTFQSVLQSVQNKGLKVTTAQAGVTLELDSAVQAKMIAPIGVSNETNEMSAVVRLVYGERSFLFTGDAGLPSEEAMIASGETLKSDVLLVGHHGSRHSTGQAFIDVVQPKYAVIQVGKNNYGHPEQEILARLTNASAKIYRTDTDGTIIFKSNGNNLEVNKSDWKYTGSSQSPNTSKQPSASNQVNNAPAGNATVTTPITVNATIDDSNPGQNASVTVTVNVKDQNGKPVQGANVQLNLHYKSTDTQYSGVTAANGVATITFRTGRAAKGFTVNGDITVTANGQTTSTQTAFTPQ
ncbi:MBL fold metallo-hydrolase [Bacillus massiliigorillae]|uniref:MBL fold metallo-hydrolase n=1 Tax=Bacillus massiliigorillae TaxID=1243664 RepID=UPI00039A97E1|nr:MBL fold metallo-hydrolase [Bacillus massiliigorillae]